MISLGQIFYHILQTHHACAYTYVRTACTHSRIHVRAHRLRIHACAHAHRLRMHAFRHVRTHTCKHTVVVTVRRTGYRYSVSPNRDGLLRL